MAAPDEVLTIGVDVDNKSASKSMVAFEKEMKRQEENRETDKVCLERLINLLEPIVEIVLFEQIQSHQPDES